MSADAGGQVADNSECCLRPSWSYLNRVLDAEAGRVRAEVVEELLANGLIVADNSFRKIYDSLAPRPDKTA